MSTSGFRSCASSIGRTRTIGLFIAGLVSIGTARGGDAKVDAAIMTEPGGREITAYVADALKLYATFKTEGVKSGDKIRCVWIADDVGQAAPAGTKITEKTLNMETDTNDGIFSLSKPTKGWPLGKYYLEIYVNDELATKLNFEIKSAPKSTKRADEKEEESSEE